MILEEPTVIAVQDPYRRHTTWLFNNGFINLDEFFDAAYIKLKPILERFIESEGACFLSACFHAEVLIDGELCAPYAHILDAQDASIYYIDADGLRLFFNTHIRTKINEEIARFLSFRDNAELMEIQKMGIYFTDLEAFGDSGKPDNVHNRYCGE